MSDCIRQIWMKTVVIAMFLTIPSVFLLDWVGVSDRNIGIVFASLNAYWMISALVLKKSFRDEDGYSTIKWSHFTIDKINILQSFYKRHEVFFGFLCFIALAFLVGWAISIQGPMNPTAKTVLLTIALTIGVILFYGVLYVILPLLIIYWIIKTWVYFVRAFRAARVADMEKAIRQSKEDKRSLHENN